jgi:hypothetical protein
MDVRLVKDDSKNPTQGKRSNPKTAIRKKITPEKRREYRINYQNKHGIEKVRLYRREHKKRNYRKNYPAIAKSYKKWYAKNKEHRRDWWREWYKKNNTPIRKLKASLRSRVYYSLKTCQQKRHEPLSQRTLSLIGARSYEEVLSYIEKQFIGGMSWENHGRKTWHIDHIIPLSSFDLQKEEERLKAFHYTNLRPVWASENLTKKDRLISFPFGLDPEKLLTYPINVAEVDIGLQKEL